jgi:hypothetical protein
LPVGRGSSGACRSTLGAALGRALVWCVWGFANLYCVSASVSVSAVVARWHSTTALEGRLTGGGMTESAWPSQPLRVSRDLSPRARAAGRAYWRRWCYYHAASSAEGEKKSVEDSDFKRLRERGLRCQSRSSAAAGQRLPGNPQAVIDRSIDSRIRLALQQPVLSAWLNSEKISCILAKISLKFSGSID